MKNQPIASDSLSARPVSFQGLQRVARGSEVFARMKTHIEYEKEIADRDRIINGLKKLLTEALDQIAIIRAEEVKARRAS